MLLAALCLLTNSSDDHFLKIEREISGNIIEMYRDEENKLASFVLQTDDDKEAGIRLTDETIIVSFVEGMNPASFQFESEASDLPFLTQQALHESGKQAPQTDVLVSVKCYRSHTKWPTGEGKQITVYDADRIVIHGYKTEGTVTLSDGTNADRWQYDLYTVYTLQNGIPLLCVQNPSDMEKSYTAQIENIEDMDEAAKENVRRFFQNRGLLYDTQAELERRISSPPLQMRRALSGGGVGDAYFSRG